MLRSNESELKLYSIFLYVFVCVRDCLAFQILMFFSLTGYWRMNNFTAEVVTSDNKTTERCGDYRKQEPVSPGGSHTFNCNNKQGRYVYVRRLEGSKEQQLITLCEVQVYGYLVTTTTTTTTTKTIQRPTLTTTMVSPQTSKPASAPTESSLKTSSESSSSIPASSENKGNSYIFSY